MYKSMENEGRATKDGDAAVRFEGRQPFETTMILER